MGRVIHKIRPPADTHWLELFRYAEGRWIPDDGELDLAFGGKGIEPGSKNWFPVAVGYDLRSGTNEAPFWVVDDSDPFYADCHPNSIAMNAAMQFVMKRYSGVANGRRVK